MSYKSWLITGASSGLGAALALEVLCSGARVVGTSRNVGKAKGAQPEFEKLGGTWLETDVTSPDCEAKVREAVEKHGVDVLVNCAGFALLGALEDISDEEIHNQLETNLTGPIRCIRAALPRFRARGSGVIVNVSSGAGHLGVPGRPLYCASKAALEGMSEALAREVAGFGIRVLTVVPGAFRTPMSDSCIVAERGREAAGEVVSAPYRGTPAEQVVRYTLNMAALGALRGDPAKAARRMLEAVTRTGMAADLDLTGRLKLFLGNDCADVVKDEVEVLKRNYDAVEAMARSTDLE